MLSAVPQPPFSRTNATCKSITIFLLVIYVAPAPATPDVKYHHTTTAVPGKKHESPTQHTATTSTTKTSSTQRHPTPATDPSALCQEDTVAMIDHWPLPQPLPAFSRRRPRLPSQRWMAVAVVAHGNPTGAAAQTRLHLR